MAKKSREKARFCAMCGDVCQSVEHHLIFGTGLRDLASQDNLVPDLCIDCHTLAFRTIDRIHDNVAAERLSKMLGQMMWERNRLAELLGDEEQQKDKVRDEFIKRYGRGYI